MNIKLLILLLVLVVSCKSETNEKNEEVLSVSDSQLQLNDGKKWIANTETHIGMKRIDSLLKNNSSFNGKLLGEAISKQTTYIIKSCNMKGKAHDQLHLVLVPILEDVSELKESKDALKSKQIQYKLELRLQDYFKYFETY
ncbi:MAG TPA: hypothetical protein P5343_00030 [Flavobacteriaceae bacterium]|nr:hypothetical protein [Flavobacteriaceae bacterium]